jgi:drug/metabolite transporter (DMT)-like permease
MLEKRNSPIKIKMDWLGAILIVCGLILFTFSVIDSSHAPQQWRTPYIYVLFIVGSLLLLAGAYVEARVAQQPCKSSSFQMFQKFLDNELFRTCLIPQST